MGWDTVMTVETAELERRLHELEQAYGLDTDARGIAESSSMDPTVLRWRREARAELTRRRWTRVEPTLASSKPGKSR
jgi:hypothetical protein